MARAGYVYVMKDDLGLCKVGQSCDPGFRRSSVAAQCGTQVEVVFEKCVGPASGWVEARAHQILTDAGHHSHSEWFTTSSDECIAAIETAAAEHEAAKSEYDATLREAREKGANVDAWLRVIDVWMRATGTVESRLGLLACANPRAVSRVMDGTATVDTLRAIVDFIDRHQARR